MDENFQAVCRAQPDSADLDREWQQLLNRACVQAKLGNLVEEAEAFKSQAMSKDLGTEQGVAEARDLQSKYRALLRALDILTEEYYDGDTQPTGI